jgi:DNA-binding HxlR family transcriptional regulator
MSSADAVATPAAAVYGLTKGGTELGEIVLALDRWAASAARQYLSYAWAPREP